MTPFEDVIRELGIIMNIELSLDSHLSCLLSFPLDNLHIQIELNTTADQILIGSQLGSILPGSYRKQIFLQAMRVNGGSLIQRGILAFSEKNDTLILFQFLPILGLNGEKLNQFIEIFKAHAKVWKEALEHGDIPKIEDDVSISEESKMFGLNP